jgi:zinc protease
MDDILGFTTDDCERFYSTYYSPNNASLVVVGDFATEALLERIVDQYGGIARGDIPAENIPQEPAQTEARRVQVSKPTPTEKVAIGYHAPALGDPDHTLLSLLCEVLAGGRASRLHKKLVRDQESCSDVRISVGPFRDPGLTDVWASAREGVSADAVLAAVDEEIERVRRELVPNEEIERAKARFELGLWHGLETCEGKAQTMGFYDCVLGQPSAAFERLDALLQATDRDLLRVAQRYLREPTRSVVLVRSGTGGES